MSDGPSASRGFRIHLLPHTRLGRRGAALLGVSLACFAATTLLANVGGLGGTGWLAFTAVPAMVAAAVGAISAGIAIVRDGERGGIALIPLVIGLYLAFLLIGEFIGPSE